MKRILFLAALVLASSLACQAVTRLVVPPTPGAAAASTPAGMETPVETATRPEVTRAAPTPIACEDDSCLDACLARINEQLESNPLADVGGEYAGAEASFNLVSYTVDGDQILEPDVLWVPSEYKEYQTDTAAQERVWNYFTSLIPAEQRQWITKYTVFTDGPSNTLAWVGTVDYDDNSKWELGVDILDASNPLDLTETLTHEMAHLVTLNSDQIKQDGNFIFTPYQNTAVCKQFISSEGCSTPESYINKFYQAFWVEIYADWMEMVYNANPSNQDELFAAVETFYDRYPNQFARLYAATNIKEDMAVSFEAFILQPRPTGNDIPAQKARFFYDFPELVALRKQMIQSLCSYAQ